MHHETSLITTMIAGIVAAFAFAAIATRLRVPPLIGYLAAGVLIGPFTPGYVADLELAPQLAELGVIFLMFGVGLHFSLDDLRAVRGVAVPGALAQIAAATGLGALLGLALGWSLPACLLFGLALSVASTVVLLKALEGRGIVTTERGRIAVGWLIVEDLVMVLALVLIPALAGGDAHLGADGGAHSEAQGGAVAGVAGLAGVVALTLAKVALFVAVMLVIGGRLMPRILKSIDARGSDELFRVAVLALALGSALGAAALFDVSYALGAFFAGMIIASTEFRKRADADSLPLRDVFAVLFFVSVGMLFDPASVLRQPLALLATVAIIVLGKSVVAWALVGPGMKRSDETALIVAASLAQIGEFSFILAEMGAGLGVLPEEARDLIVAGALISITLNPVAFRVAEAIAARRGGAV